MTLFDDRRAAGRQLGERLSDLRDRRDALVVGIPRGGVVVADEVARVLGLPLDVLVTHKIGAPFNPELALGAVASDGTVYLDQDLIDQLHIPHALIEHAQQRQLREIHRRAELYRQGQPPLPLRDRTVILVDDGVATGSTTIAALRAIKKQGAAARILAAPVAPAPVVTLLRQESDRVVLIDTPDPFFAVGYFYLNFEQTTDEQVIEILRAARPRQTSHQGSA